MNVVVDNIEDPRYRALANKLLKNQVLDYMEKQVQVLLEKDYRVQDYMVQDYMVQDYMVMVQDCQDEV